MEGGTLDSNIGVSRRTIIALLAACCGYMGAIGPIAAIARSSLSASTTADPSAALIRELVNRLDSKALLCLAASELSLIEIDYFGHVNRNRPGDLWECIETWPTEAKQDAVDVLLPMIVANEPLLR